MSQAPDFRTFVYSLDSDEIDIPFWEACARHEFLLYRCGICGRHYWPAALCVAHGGRDMAWAPVSGQGVVHDHVTLHKARPPAHLPAGVPFNLSIIKLKEGPLLHSNVIDCPAEEVRSGLEVEVVFTPAANGITLPLFRRRR